MTVLPLLLLLLISATTTTISAQTTIPLNSNLSASDPTTRWTSPNAAFSFAFIPNPNFPSFLIAAINYSTIPIWSATTPTLLNSSAVLRLQSTGDLQLLSSPASTTPLWSSATDNLNVTSANLTDSGNFILLNSSGDAVWSTFDNPTDTIVPDQTFGVNRTLTSGIYTFGIRSNGNLTLTWNNSIIFYNSPLNSTANANSTLTSPVINIQPIGILALSDPSLPVSQILAYSSDYAEQGDILRFIRLDRDGNLRIYSSARNSGAVTERWAAVSDQCQVFGYCGNMGICSYNETGPVCGCPSRNFELVDPLNSRRGCRRTVELSACRGNQTMLQVDNARFLTYEPELSSEVFYVGISPCSQLCLTGPSCVSSTSLSDGSGMCYLKTGSYLSGYRSAALPSTSYVKVCLPAMPNLSASASGRTTRWRLTTPLIAVVVMVTILGLVAIEGGLWWWCFRNHPKFGGLSAQYALLEYASGAPVQFSYKELEKATKGFKEKLGEGGFGTVYRAVLTNKTVAAAKQLEGIEQGEKQFRMEVATISSTHHLNLVRLIGFCSEGRHRLLVYEFMKNGSLDNFLFISGEQSGKHLNWEHRYNIALGTARGITYLHEECRDCIVHCDIKPENILLDDNFNAKVSDFGLAKLVNPKDHRQKTLTSVRGTRGYLAPEWIANLPITLKSDVYSYGMVLLEIVSGRRNFDVSIDTNQKKFSVWAYEEFKKGNIEAIIDKNLSRSEINMDQVMRVILVSFWCIQEQPSHRPIMSKVVQMLDGIVEIGMPPAPKAVREVSVTGSRVIASSNSGSSTFSSLPVRSSSSTGISSSVSRKGADGDSSSLLRSEIM